MKTIQAYRYELRPNNRQVGQLLRHCGTARFVYNWGLAKQLASLRLDTAFPSWIQLHRELVVLKKSEFGWMYGVSKCAPQGALKDLDRAWAYKRKGHGRRPRFKKRGKHDSFKLTGTLRVLGRHVQLPRLGHIRTKESTDKLKGRILSVVVSREANRWYCSVSVERDRPDFTPPQGRPVGIDLGVKMFAVLSDKTEVRAPKPLKQHLRKIQRLSMRVSRKKKGSNNRRKAVLRLARQYRKVRNIRKDFLHKFTSDLTKTKQVICIENLNVAGMVRNRKLARVISDLGWGEFKRQLQYKSEWYGSRVVVIDRWFPSSKMCSCCGHTLDQLDLGTRAWTCLGCGVHHGRDYNAAVNILIEGLGAETLRHYPEFQGNLRLWRSGKSGACVGSDRGSRKQTLAIAG